MVANPFFAPASAFFAPSVGDKVDSAIAQGKAAAADAQKQGKDLLNKAELKVQDAKQAAKDVAAPAPTGVDLYARYVLLLCLWGMVTALHSAGEVEHEYGWKG
jgi:solute carrier family 25 phosphate transporter 3